MATKRPPAANADAAESVSGVRKIEQTERAQPVAAADSVEGVAAAAAVAEAAPVHAVQRAAASELVASVADRLRRGVLTPSQAVEELVDDAVRKNLPGLDKDSALGEALRGLLRTYAEDDPYLTTRIDRLRTKR